MNHKTVIDKDFKIIESDYKLDYQDKLTAHLDNDTKDFDQTKLNEVVLWKVNRYVDFDDNLISMINSIDQNQTELNIGLTKKVLEALLRTKGVRLPMASTILRFRNEKIYQIIDQRVYRVIYPNQELRLNNYLSKKNIDNQIELYFKYLDDLKKVCENLDIPYEKSDRILFMADRRINKNHKIRTN